MVALNFKNDVPPLPPFFMMKIQNGRKSLIWTLHCYFFSMGDMSKTLFPSMGFSYPGNLNLCFFVILGGPYGSLLARF